MQKAFDELYQQSKNGNNFYKLLEIIGSEQNICLAYRNLKTNSGSKTAGTDGKTIEDIKGLSDREVIETVRKQLADYHPQSVRRVFIPKPGSDKKRPLGIPCIWDRLIQQCILQVLEPICEPKFHNHSYGFRQNRDAHHAVSRVVSMVNMYKHYYCVDVDIKGFFDNVNHGKLLKQIWTLGIRDKRLLCIISKILKSEIEGDMRDSHVGLQARLMSQAMRKLAGIINKSKTVAIFINQIREKVGVLFGSPETTSGGRALKFYSTIRLDIRRVDQIKQGTEAIGNLTRIKVVKNKVAPPFKIAEVDLIYGKGISYEGEVLDLATNLDIVEKSGSWFSYNGERLGQGRETVKELLRQNPELAKEIELKVREKIIG